jgi:nitrogen fixation NifU-like protein
VVAIEYNEKVLDHFFNPRNVGVMEEADGIGHLGDASCGDVFVMYIKVWRGRIVDIKYQVQGCGAAIATCSALSEIAMGKTIREAWRLTDDDISAELGGLPLEKLHCSNLAATVLHRAIVDYAENPRGDRRDWKRLYQQLG